MRRRIAIALACCISFAAAASLAASSMHEVTQLQRKFSVKRLQIKKGEVVQFKNLDPFFHNVYSMTPGSEFDLGAYPQGESKPVSFKKPGIVDVECALHPEMKMQIEVSE